MKNVLNISLLLILILGFSNCTEAQWGTGLKGSGPVVKETLSLDDLSGFSLMISGDVYLQQGDRQAIVVEGQKNVIDVLNQEVKDGFWKIKFTERVRNHSNFKVYITLPDLEEAYVSGSGDIFGRGKFTTSGDLSLAVSGSGNVELEVETANLDGRISGSGDIKITGSCKDADLSISGSGSIGGNDFNCENAKIVVSGSGDVNLNVVTYLDIAVSGSGDITYGGQPRIKSRISGSGEVTQKAF